MTGPENRTSRRGTGSTGSTGPAGPGGLVGPGRRPVPGAATAAARPPRPARPGHGRLRGLLASLGILALVAGVPAVMLAMGIHPVPGRLPDGETLRRDLFSRDNGSLALAALATVVWATWLIATFLIVVELVFAVGRFRVRDLPLLGRPQGAARDLVATAALLFVAGATLAQTVGGVSAPPADASPASAADAPVTAATNSAMHPAAGVTSSDRSAASSIGLPRPGSTGAAGTAREHRHAATIPHTVRAGDNLWDLAETYLGDGARYRELVALNHHLVGDNPGFLSPGWVLRVPAPPHTALADEPGHGPTPRDISAASGVGTGSYLVRAGDTLSGIAEEHLGDADRWREIFTASTGLTQADGDHLTVPDLIRPGWTLRLPAAAIASSAAGGQQSRPPHTGSAGPVRPSGPATGGEADRVTPQDPAADVPSFPAPRVPDTTPTKAPTTTPGSAPSRAPSRAPTSAPPTSQPSPAPVTPETSAPGPDDRRGPTPTTVEANGDGLSAPWVVPGLAGGAVLAASLLLILRARRRAQFRARRPGRAIAAPPPDLIPYERTIMVAGDPLDRSVALLDEMLRRLAGDVTADQPAGPGVDGTGRGPSTDAAVPPVAAVELSDATATLHLTEPRDLPHPWAGTPDGLRWTASLASDADSLADTGDQGTARPTDRGRQSGPAPFPLLATVGRDDGGHWWLLNLEHLGTIAVGGDVATARDLLRYVACELSLSPWADSARVDAVGGVGREAERMNPTRVRHHPTDRPGARVGHGTGGGTGSGTGAGTGGDVDSSHVDDTVDDTVRGTVSGTVSGASLVAALDTAERSRRFGVDASTGRVTQVDEELWPALLLLFDATADEDRDSGSLDRLVDLIGEQADRTGAAVVLTGHDLVGGFALHLTAAGRLRIDQARLDLVPVGLSCEAADGAARVLEQSRDTDGVEVAVDPSVSDGWQAFADNSGALRTEFTLPRDLPVAAGAVARVVAGVEAGVDEVPRPPAPGYAADRGEAPRSLLEDLDAAYLETAAVAPQDLDRVAPRVPARVRAAVEAADPTLDADYAAWVGQNPTRPRLRVLGPVRVTAGGQMREIAERVGFYTELVAYLASRSRHGATTAEVMEAMAYASPGRVRVDMTVLRGWLGDNPLTGRPLLPKATEAPAQRVHGRSVYQLDTGPGGVLVDSTLFRRKRARAQSRGQDGIDDLRQALTLVDGAPYSRLREGGWSWLLEGDRDDEQAKVAISDTAHVLTTHYLHVGDVTNAAAAARIGVLAAPDEDTMQLNLARVMLAQGRASEATRLLDREIFNRSDEGLAPRDLSERTKQVVDRWPKTETG